MKKYKTIVIDPPWKYGVWGKNSGKGCRGDFSGRKDVIVALPYSFMSLEEIEHIPLYELADSNCDCYLWVTQKYLPNGFGLLNHWGFKYCQTLTWCKTPRGLGQGGLFVPTTEFILLGRRGNMPKYRRIDSTWWNIKRPHNSHSTKPEFFQDLIESVSDAPRLEMFARRKRQGWDCWGNEIESDIEIPIKSAVKYITQQSLAGSGSSEPSPKFAQAQTSAS